MNEPEPGDLDRKLAETFPDDDRRNVARTLLAQYGSESWHREPDRVRRAVLKIAGSDLTKLGVQVENASIDYRDVLARAEYPAYLTLEPGIDPDSPRAQAAIESDRRQYEEWLAPGPG